MKKGLLILFLLVNFATTAQESLIREFAEADRKKGWLYPICLYPSTLRMINVSNDPSYNDLVGDIEKVLIYNLDSATIEKSKDSNWFGKYLELGYEELFTLYGAQKVKIINKKDEYVGFVSANGNSMAIYLRGNLSFEKLPSLVNNFNGDNIHPLLREYLQNE